MLKVSPSGWVSGEAGPHLGPGEGFAEGVCGRRGRAGPGSGGLGIGEAGFEGLVVGVDFEALFVGGNGVVVLGEAEVGGAEAAVALGPVGLELDGLLGVG